MSDVMLLFAGLFLPLFPMSMLFNELFDRAKMNLIRALLLVVWPQIGIAIAYTSGIDIPGWILVWALLTALIYAFRALVLREVSLWISFLATSSWAILWVVMDGGASGEDLIHYALAFSVPFAILVLLSGELEKRFGAAYTGLYNGIAETLPRLSGVLVVTVLAAIATPLFPSFSAMLAAIISASAQSFTMALLLCLVWLIWGWASARLIQGLIIGESKQSNVADITSGRAWIYALGLTFLIFCGINMLGGLA